MSRLLRHSVRILADMKAPESEIVRLTQAFKLDRLQLAAPSRDRHSAPRDKTKSDKIGYKKAHSGTTSVITAPKPL